MYCQFPLIETKPIRDIFSNGISSVGLIAPGIRRITLFALKQCAFDGRIERDIVARIIMADTEIDMACEYVEREMQPDIAASHSTNITPLFDH